MKTNELTALLGISKDTVTNWTRREELAAFFSPDAKGETPTAHRTFTEADVLVLNTINRLRNVDKVTDWQEIAAHLDAGKRFQEFPQNAITADPRTIPLPQAEQSARAAATVAERDAALARVNELETEVDRLRQELRSEQDRRETGMERLLREIAELNREIGKLQAMLDMKGQG